ncbi:FAD-binding oxidoreductase [Deinococcus yavapaiensis]|uniref:FAD-binding PCMH-type domain-containing protein n=1 Tax=Deinococcus yavapaiensis KR-236 TaxID=694435 RepID=A0A318SCU5_9DEIO|nr:DUF5639 domain-containing protein [Deinococcus yavapaiensis]PYE54188.1 hypothetical protein DES52_106154 [Deinococcus yavapaiensis KR-236]
MTTTASVRVSSDDQVLTASASTSLQDVYAALPAGLFPPFPNVELPGGVGDLIARGGFGQTFFFAGDVLGATFRTRSGRIVKAGGRVVKNVQGYDLTRLLVGSFGVLGEVVDVTLRLRPGRAFVQAKRAGALTDLAALPITPRFAWQDGGEVFAAHFGAVREVERFVEIFGGEEVGTLDFTRRFPDGMGVGPSSLKDGRFAWANGHGRPSVPMLFERLAEAL